MSYEKKLFSGEAEKDVSASGLPWEGYYYSAYGIAVKHGYPGTEAEWVQDLYGGKISAAKSAAAAAASAGKAASAGSEAETAKGEAIAAASYAAKLVGYPAATLTAAGMTDEDKIYVYCGNEDGYVHGGWYFYQSDGWVYGGMFNTAVQIMTDEFGSTFPSAQAMYDAHRTAEETPVYTFQFSDLGAGHYTEAGEHKTTGANTWSHPIRYDDSMVLEMISGRTSERFYVHIGDIEGGVMDPESVHTEAFYGASQTLNLRVLKRYGEWVTFSFTGATPPFICSMRSPMCKLDKRRVLTFTAATVRNWARDSSNRILFYSGKVINSFLSAAGVKYLYANGLGMSAEFYRTATDGSRELIGAAGENMGVVEPVPSDNPGAWDTTKQYRYTGSAEGYSTGGWYWYDGEAWVLGWVRDNWDAYPYAPDMSAPGNTLLPRLITVPEGCDYIQLAVFGIQRTSASAATMLGSYITDVIPEICAYGETVRASVPDAASGQAVRAARMLADFAYTAQSLRTQNFVFQPVITRTAPVRQKGFPYGRSAPGISRSYYTYLSSYRFNNAGINATTPPATNSSRQGFQCTAFISEVLGLSPMQGTEWWLQNYGDRLRQRTADTVPEVGDLLLTQRYYASAPDWVRRKIWDGDVTIAASDADVTVPDTVYLVGGRYKYLVGSTVTEARRSLSTHIALVTDKVHDPKTGAFIGLEMTESANIWTRSFVRLDNSVSDGPDQVWIMKNPITDVKMPWERYRFAIDREEDPLRNPDIEFPPAVSFCGDRVLIPDGEDVKMTPVINGKQCRFSGELFYLYRPFYFDKTLETMTLWVLDGSTWEQIGDEINITELPGYDDTTLATCATAAIRDLIPQIDGVAVPGTYKLDFGEGYVPTVFRVPNVPVIDCNAAQTILTVSSIGSFEKIRLRAIPTPVHLPESDRLPPYVNYVLLDTDWENRATSPNWTQSGGDWIYTLPTGYQFFAGVSFVDDLGSMSVRISDDYDLQREFDPDDDDHDGGDD